jgi:predicted secreted protein
MPWFSAVVMFAVIWVMTFLVLLPIGLRTQGEEGERVPGTPSGAPVNFRFKPLAWKVTLVSVVVWGLMFAVVKWGGLTLDDFGFFDLTPSSN